MAILNNASISYQRTGFFHIHGALLSQITNAQQDVFFNPTHTMRRRVEVLCDLANAIRTDAIAFNVKHGLERDGKFMPCGTLDALLPYCDPVKCSAQTTIDSIGKACKWMEKNKG